MRWLKGWTSNLKPVKLALTSCCQPSTQSYSCLEEGPLFLTNRSDFNNRDPQITMIHPGVGQRWTSHWPSIALVPAIKAHQHQALTKCTLIHFVKISNYLLSGSLPRLLMLEYEVVSIEILNISLEQAFIKSIYQCFTFASPSLKYESPP